MSWPLKKLPGLSLGIECNALRSSKVFNAERVIDTGFIEYRGRQDSYTQMVSLSPYLEISTNLENSGPTSALGLICPFLDRLGLNLIYMTKPAY